MVQHDSCSLERLVSSFLLVEINSSSREGLPLTNKRERSSGTRILLHNYYEAMLRYSTDIRRSNFFVKFQFGNGVTLREIYLNLWLVKRKLEGSAKIKSKIEKHPILTFSVIRSLDWSFRLIDVLKIKEKEKKHAMSSIERHEIRVSSFISTYACLPTRESTFEPRLFLGRVLRGFTQGCYGCSV